MIGLIVICLIIFIDSITFSILKSASKADDCMLGDEQYEW